MLSSTMNAVSITTPGGPEVLGIESLPVPVPQQGEILVRVAGAGLNRADIVQREGNYNVPAGAPKTLGLEISGEVVALGPQVARWRVGDKVAALVVGGGYAEFATVHESNAMPIPAGMTEIEAAALPETFMTVWHNVFERGGLKPGETLLVHGGSSGIGTTAIMLANAFGAKVLATARSKAKCDACLSLGATRAIDYRNEDFVAAVKDATGGKGADVILDMVGGAYVSRNYQAAAMDGRIVQIATLEGGKPEVDIRTLMQKRLTHTGSTLRGRSIEFKAALARALEQKVWPMFADKRIWPLVDKTFPLREAGAAHARLQASDHIGKIILVTGQA